MNVVLRYVRGNRCHSVKALPGGRVMVEEYFPGGELKKVSGADTYTQEWTYDPVWGQKATLTTYKDASTPQVTGWTYNNRGFNVAKSYPDGTGPSYSYDADGKLQTRTWARGVVATYAYDAAGRASGVSYSDETPAIAVSYDFLGRAVTITDASGTKNLTYNSNSQLENETIPHIVNLSIQYGYDAYGRQTLRQLKQNDMVHASVSLSYDSRGRTATVGNGADVLHYAYRAGRNQLETAEWKNAQNAVLNSRSYAYDSYHRLTGINLNGTLEVGYTLNDKDRRTGAEYANSGLWNFTYDDKGQVISALGSSRSFAYAYDGIGNRTSATEGGRAVQLCKQSVEPVHGCERFAADLRRGRQSADERNRLDLHLERRKPPDCGGECGYACGDGLRLHGPPLREKGVYEGIGSCGLEFAEALQIRLRRLQADSRV